MKLDVAAGWGFVGVGAVLAWGTPPPWWPDMPTFWVRLIITMGAILIGLGIALIVRRPVIAGLGWPSGSVAQINLDQHMQNIRSKLPLTKRQKLMRFLSDFWTRT